MASLNEWKMERFRLDKSADVGNVNRMDLVDKNIISNKNIIKNKNIGNNICSRCISIGSNSGTRECERNFVKTEPHCAYSLYNVKW